MELRESVEELAPLAEAILSLRDNLNKQEAIASAITDGEKRISDLREQARQAVARYEGAQANFAKLNTASQERDRIIASANEESKAIIAKAKVDAEESVAANTKYIEEQTEVWGRKLNGLSDQAKAIQASIDRKREEHDQIQSSLDALRRRLG